MSDDQQKEWYRNYSAHIRGSPDVIMAIEKTISNITNIFNCNRNDAIARLFNFGCMYAQENGDEALRDTDIQKDQSIAVALFRQRAKRSRSSKLGELYFAMGEDEFRVWCSENNQDPEPTVLLYRDLRLPTTSTYASESDKIAAWLEFALRDGELHKAEDVVQEALNAGLLPDKTSDNYEVAERNLRSIASRRGFTSKLRGYWNLPVV